MVDGGLMMHGADSLDFSWEEVVDGSCVDSPFPEMSTCEHDSKL